MASHVASRVEEQRVFGLHCPHEGCKNELFEKDLQGLPLADGVLEQFSKLRAQDYKQRAAELMHIVAEDVDARELYRVARLCPRCSVVLQKSGGCNSFYCICGHHVQYDKAPLICPPHFKKALSMAARLDMTLAEAETRVLQGFFKSSRVAGQMGLSLEDARDLQKRAQAGDEEARAQIRAARQKPCGANQ